MLQRLASSLALGARRLQPDRLRVLLQLEAAPQLEGKAATSAHTLVSCSDPCKVIANGRAGDRPAEDAAAGLAAAGCCRVRSC